jgi:hypothetical protein
MFLLLSDVLSGLLPSDDPRTFYAEECFGFSAYMFADRCQSMDVFSLSIVLAFMYYVTELNIPWNEVVVT